MFDLCTPELQQRLTPVREKFKAEEDKRVEVAQTVTLNTSLHLSDSHFACISGAWLSASPSLVLMQL